MGISATLSSPFYLSASSTSAEVPDNFHIAIDGHTYMIDTDFQGQWGYRTLPLIRQQADQSLQPSEQTLSPDELWRRSHESWHRGAGQDYVDRPASDPYRFKTSKGIDPWGKWGLSLLPDTDEKLNSANTNLQLAVVGDYLYVADGADVKFTDDVSVDTPTWTTMTGLSGTAIQSIASDGQYIYITDGADIFRTAAGTTAAGAAWNTLDADLLGYVKGRLMAAHDGSLYNVTDGTAPASLFDHPNGSAFTWIGFAPGPKYLYAAGHVGDKSLIYKTAVKADGTGLDTPVVAGELPDGEVVRSISGYLGHLLLGTDEGVRFATVNDDGEVTAGKIVGPDQSVYAFEGQDRFVWFGWTNYDNTSSGLGRLDLTQFTDQEGLAPSYASDLMATGQGAVKSVVTFEGLTVFTVSGDGVYAEDSDLVSSGVLDSGEFTYGLPADDKVALYVDVRHEPLSGTVEASLSTDGGSFTLLGSSSTSGSTKPGAPLPAGESKGQTFAVQVTLSRDSTTTSDGPTLTRYTVRAYPSPPRGREWVIPVLLHTKLRTVSEKDDARDPEDDLERLEDVALLRKPVTFQLGERRESVVLEDIEWVPNHLTEDRKWWNGTAVLRLKKFSQN